MLVDAPFNTITGEIIGAAIEVHRTIGPGLLESTYMPCLQIELAARSLRFAAERAVPIVYKGTALDTKYRVDLIVEDLVVVEVKSVDQLLPVHRAHRRVVGTKAESLARQAVRGGAGEEIHGGQPALTPGFIRASSFVSSVSLRLADGRSDWTSITSFG
jgi:GxxExxY protein